VGPDRHRGDDLRRHRDPPPADPRVPGGGVLYVIDWATTALFAAGIVLNFRTPIQLRRHRITDKKRIARHYLKTWFTIDFLATIPFDLLVGQALPLSDVTVRVLRMLRVTRVARLLRLADLLDEASFDQVLARYPRFAARIRKVAAERRATSEESLSAVSRSARMKPDEQGD